MSSFLYRGRVTHRRMQPVPHAFDYPLFFFGIDVAELPRLSLSLRSFSYNRFNLFSIHDRDYLAKGTESLFQKLVPMLETSAGSRAGGSVRLITCARFVNYVFNPVSFYLFLDRDGGLEQVVVEVNNTFGDRHVYRLDHLEEAGPGRYRGMHAKEFHVSPFNDMQGTYRFTFHLPPGEVHIGIDTIKQNQVVFQAGLSGSAQPLTDRNIAHTLLRYPLTAAMTMPRIMAQAAQLYYRKRLKVYKRPTPKHPMTIRRRAV